MVIATGGTWRENRRRPCLRRFNHHPIALILEACDEMESWSGVVDREKTPKKIKSGKAEANQPCNISCPKCALAVLFC